MGVITPLQSSSRGILQPQPMRKTGDEHSALIAAFNLYSDLFRIPMGSIISFFCGKRLQQL